MFEQKKGRFARAAYENLEDMKCERVDPAKRRVLQEKFELAESYLGRFIDNILRHFTDERRVQAVSR